MNFNYKISVYIILVIFFIYANCNDMTFDKTKIKNYTSSMDLNTIVAPIINQVWIASKKSSKEELINLVSNSNPKFIIKVIK